jgi:hypothetical protein
MGIGLVLSKSWTKELNACLRAAGVETQMINKSEWISK